MIRKFSFLGGYFVALTLFIAMSTFGQEVKPAGKSEASGDPLRILLITSGCCHDYDFQTKAMQLALKKRGVAATWDVVSEGGTGTSAQIGLYDDADWADGYRAFCICVDR